MWKTQCLQYFQKGDFKNDNKLDLEEVRKLLNNLNVNIKLKQLKELFKV